MSTQLNKVKCQNEKKPIFNSLIKFIGLLLLFFFTTEVIALTEVTRNKYDKDKALAFSQAAINNTIGSYQFLDQDKKQVDITQYRGKPLIISLIYTSCHHICPTTTKHLAEVTRIAREALGDNSFSVITVGFDTVVDSPERMRLYARERNINIPNWDFLSTDQVTINAFSDDLGFIFFKSPKGFDHLSQTTLLDAEGKVYRQIYGMTYDPPHLIEPLKELVFGQHQEAGLVEGWINNIRLFCTIYDPHSGRYEFDYSIFIGIAIGILMLGGIATFIVREWRHDNKNRLT